MNQRAFQLLSSLPSWIQRRRCIAAGLMTSLGAKRARSESRRLDDHSNAAPPEKRSAMTSGLDGMTYLMSAAADGNEACVAMLLPISDPHARCELGMTPLMHAAQGGSLACVARLLQLSDASALDFKGASALTRAAAAGHYGCAELINDYVNSRPDLYGCHDREQSHRGTRARRSGKFVKVGGPLPPALNAMSQALRGARHG